jgi:heme o synthase
MFDYIRLWAELNKVKITIAVTLTTLAGFTLSARTIDHRIVVPLIGIFILACGAAALNHFQERKEDVLMERTKNRPIPSGAIKPGYVVLISFIEIILGIWLIYIGSSWIAALLGFITLVWYNLIYTPLKKISAFAVIPGSVIGAIPPMVGWVVGGGHLLDERLIIIALFFFISQVPHFWLLMLKYGDEYQSAGFPTINNILTPVQIRRVTFVWVVAASLDAVMLVVTGILGTLFFKVLVVLASIWLVAIFSKLLGKTDTEFKPFKYFMRLNYVLLIIIISMIIDPLL